MLLSSTVSSGLPRTSRRPYHEGPTSTVFSVLRRDADRPILRSELRQCAIDARWPRRAVNAEGVQRAPLSCPARRPAGDEAGIARRGVAGCFCRRRGAQGVDPGDPEGAGGRGPASAVHRDCTPERLPIYRRRKLGSRTSDRTGASGRRGDYDSTGIHANPVRCKCMFGLSPARTDGGKSHHGAGPSHCGARTARRSSTERKTR